MIRAAVALERLREGNRRFVANQAGAGLSNPARRAELVSGQEPFAIILGCSDSRVPAELVFDQGFGDLFVIRVAGNVVAPSQVGSVEFAAARFGTRLVLVLGHSQCGAVGATLEEVLGRATSQSRNLRSIVDRVRPSVEALLSGGRHGSPEALVRDAVRANVLASVDQLRRGSELLERLIHEDGLRIVGAEYSLETGVVTFYEEEAADRSLLDDFGRRYARAWCSQDPAAVAAFFSEAGSLSVNGGAPAVGRRAIAEVARGFMTDFPDLRVTMDGVDPRPEGAVFRWTLDGTHTGPGGTGRRVKISGHELWRFGPDGLVAESQGRFDPEEYRRQLQGGAGT